MHKKTKIQSLLRHKREISMYELRAYITSNQDYLELGQCGKAIKYIDTELSLLHGMAQNHLIDVADQFVSFDSSGVTLSKPVKKVKTITETLGVLKDGVDKDNRWFITELLSIVNFYQTDIDSMYERIDSIDAFQEAYQIYLKIMGELKYLKFKYNWKRYISLYFPGLCQR